MRSRYSADCVTFVKGTSENPPERSVKANELGCFWLGVKVKLKKKKKKVLSNKFVNVCVNVSVYTRN